MLDNKSNGPEDYDGDIVSGTHCTILAPILVVLGCFILFVGWYQS